MKKRSIVAAVLSVMFLLTGPAYAEKFTPDNTVVIGREITGRTMQPVISKVLELTTAKKVLPNLNIIISSPGGSVNAGLMFLSVLRDLKSHGTKVTCYVPGIAASMAFHILTQCDKRVVLVDSLLLWHRARVMTSEPITGPIAATIARDLDTIDALILAEVSKTVGKDMSDKDVRYHFEVETLHIGISLCNQAPSFCTAVESVPGMFSAMVDEKIVHAEAPFNPFGKAFEMVYIWSQALRGAQ